MGLIAKLLGSRAYRRQNQRQGQSRKLKNRWRSSLISARPPNARSTRPCANGPTSCWSTGADDRIAELDAEADRLRLVVERCDAAEPILVAELAGARDRRRREQWRGLRDILFARSRNYLTQMHSAKAAFDAMVDARSEAIDAGFGAEVAAMFPPRCMCSPSTSFNQFERGLERAESMASQPRKPAPTAATTCASSAPEEAGQRRGEFLEPPVAVMGGRPPGRPGEVKRVSPMSRLDWCARLRKICGQGAETAPRPENAEASK